MSLTQIFLLVILILIVALFEISTAQKPCTTDGWFGPNCQYQCHCANSAQCDEVDGSCSPGCHTDWFGPACQYNRMRFRNTEFQWLTDNNDATCNPSNTQTVNVELGTPIPLTWIRVVFNDAAYLNQIQLKYQLSTKNVLQTCTNLRTATVDNVTVDLHCPTNMLVSVVSVSGPGVKKLCSLDVSGGRNVALKQKALQSSTYFVSSYPNAFLAGYAVDGNTGVASQTSSMSTCTHTDITDSPDWWTLAFSIPVDVASFLIINRKDCCQDRLIGFTLKAQPEPGSTDTTFSYTDSKTTNQDSFTVVPSPKISYPVAQIRVDVGPNRDILTLCEMFVYGETRCPAGQFGLACERQCNCANQASCFVHSGGCPIGCASGFAGADCSKCEAGRFGTNCTQDCTPTCAGDNSCDRVSGDCLQGCDSGFTGASCDTECPAGTYGINCSMSCSVNCGGPDNVCHRESGVCDNGCDPGYWGDMCQENCSATCGGPDKVCHRDTGVCDNGCDSGYWGNTCQENCSSTCGGPDKVCHRDTGVCSNGCDSGYWGDTCQENCSFTCGGSDHACEQDSGACNNCPLGFYSTTCLEPCNSNCSGPDNACDLASGTCLGCEPGFYGDTCSNPCSNNCWGPNNECDKESGACAKCNPGLYGVNCAQSCSVTCAGSGHPCGIIDGSCVEGCLSGYTGKTCHQALPQNLDSEGSDYKTWAIAATAAAVVVFVVAVVIIGILVWRFRHRSSETQLNNRMTTGNEEGKPESEGVLFDNVDGGKLSKFKTLDTANNHDGTDYQPSQDLCQHEYEKPMPTPQDSHEYKIAGNEYVTPNEYENPQEIVKNSEHPTEVTGNNEILNAKDDMKESVYYLAD